MKLSRKIGLSLVAATTLLASTAQAQDKVQLGCIYPKRVVQRINLSADALFDFDKANLKPAGRASLDRLSHDLRRARQIHGIQVVGHTDSIGSASYNQRLSERRASSVKHHLVNRGVESGIISTRGMGERQPIAPNKRRHGADNPAGRVQNRRVEVEIEADQLMATLLMSQQPTTF